MSYIGGLCLIAGAGVGGDTVFHSVAVGVSGLVAPKERTTRIIRNREHLQPARGWESATIDKVPARRAMRVDPMEALR